MATEGGRIMDNRATKIIQDTGPNRPEVCEPFAARTRSNRLKLRDAPNEPLSGRTVPVHVLAPSTLRPSVLRGAESPPVNEVGRPP